MNGPGAFFASSCTHHSTQTVEALKSIAIEAIWPTDLTTVVTMRKAHPHRSNPSSCQLCSRHDVLDIYGNDYVEQAKGHESDLTPA
eukprot:6381765-Amphidinium_carterae.1